MASVATDVRPSGVETSGAPPAPHMDAQPMVSPSAASKRAVADDKFYGHRVISEVAERMLMALFSCSHDSMAATADAHSVSSSSAPRLAHFVAYALYRTRLPMIVTYYALLLLKRLKTRYPVARGSSGHRLFISAFMLASKMVCDDSYNNKSWTIVGQGLFSLAEVNQMERELLNYLDLHLDVAPTELALFAEELQQYGAPAVPMEDLCATRIPVAPKKETPQPTEPARPARHNGHRRRPSHRRCLSLKPDFWTQGNAANAPSMPHRADSEWNVSRRPVLRASMPAQRTAPTSVHAACVASVASMTQSASQHGLPDRMPNEWGAFYASNNVSCLSMETPSSITSSMRLTPSTSFSDTAPSPWTGMPSYTGMLPYATPGYPPQTIASTPHAAKDPHEFASELGPPMGIPMHTLYSS